MQRGDRGPEAAEAPALGSARSEQSVLSHFPNAASSPTEATPAATGLHASPPLNSCPYDQVPTGATSVSDQESLSSSKGDRWEGRDRVESPGAGCFAYMPRLSLATARWVGTVVPS